MIWFYQLPKAVAITLREDMVALSFNLWNADMQIINTEFLRVDLHFISHLPFEIALHPETSKNKKLDAADTRGRF